MANITNTHNLCVLKGRSIFYIKLQPYFLSNKLNLIQLFALKIRLENQQSMWISLSLVTWLTTSASGAHPIRNLKIKTILTFSYFHRKVKIYPNFTAGNKRKLR